ncbi:MAG: hypothetical protein CVT68_04695 [Actinobacteria bacterium HGW-Actinobacteria-8]|nr:MAG: hypothetical protein CVT68_04695 [Actinobacteria bacterium HGW-Actinobacteria-8]
MTYRLLDHWARPVVLACVIALIAAGVVASSPRVAGADTYPGLADIAAGKASVSDAAATVAELDAAVVKLEQARADAENAALLAADVYATAKGDAERAQRQSVAASGRADDAVAALDSARSDLGAIAMEAYRSGGSMTSVEAILGADGFEDVIARSEDYGRAAAEVDSVVQRVRASEVVAGTMSDFAADAAQEAADAAAAAVALTKAEDSRRVAEQAVADAQATREDAVVRLAQLQNTTVQLEQQRQAGLASDRQRAQQAQLAAALAAAEKAAAEQTAATQPPPATSPPATSPPATSPPATTPPPVESTGTWSSSASQGQAAAAFAQTLVGSPYQLGGNGPAYDCSGLTRASWGSTGVWLPHSSRSQYGAVAHVPFSQLRPGDLIFWGTNRDANSIYHVAIYIGSGLVVEATVPGSTAKIRSYASSWNLGDIMPYAGRP